MGNTIQPLNFDLNQDNLERNNNVITPLKPATLKNKTVIRNLPTECGEIILLTSALLHMLYILKRKTGFYLYLQLSPIIAGVVGSLCVFIGTEG